MPHDVDRDLDGVSNDGETEVVNYVQARAALSLVGEDGDTAAAFSQLLKVVAAADAMLERTEKLLGYAQAVASLGDGTVLVGTGGDVTCANIRIEDLVTQAKDTLQ